MDRREFPKWLVEAIADRDELTLDQTQAKLITMSREERLDEWLTWEGIQGYTSKILAVVDIPELPAFLREYRVNHDGIVVSPGKYEGQPLWVPWFHSQVLDGEGEVLVESGEDGQGVLMMQVKIMPDDIKLFPELDSFLACIVEIYPDGSIDHELVELSE